MYWLRPGDTWSKEFNTSAQNGQAVNADSPPTVVLARNHVVDEEPVEVTVTSISTGVYLASCVIPAEYEPGDVVTLRVSASVLTVPGKDTLAEERLIGIDLTDEIADQLFEDGTDYKLKVNENGSTDGQVVLSNEQLSAIASEINDRTLNANQIAAALAALQCGFSVNLIGPLMPGNAHRIVRGSAFLHADGMSPFIRVPKANRDLTGATAQFRMKVDRQVAVSVTATIISVDENFWEVYADLLATKTDDMQPGTGIDQFWATLASGSVVCLIQNYLEVLDGIAVP